MSNLQISQANLGSAGSLGVSASIGAAATGAFLKTAIPAVGAAAAQATGTTAAFTNGAAGTGTIAITANADGTQYNGVHLILETDADTAANDPQATYNAAAKEIIVKVNNLSHTTQDDIATAITGQTPFTAVASDHNAGTTLLIRPRVATSARSAGRGSFWTRLRAAPPPAPDQGGGLASAVQMQINGSTGSQVFSFAAGSTAATMAATINLASIRRASTPPPRPSTRWSSPPTTPPMPTAPAGTAPPPRCR